MGSDIHTKFEQMGARIRVTALPDLRGGRMPRWQRWQQAGRAGLPVSIDIRRDDDGEYFELQHRTDVAVQVLDIRPADRHLLLMAREPGGNGRSDSKSRFLCGHDERSWFVAAIPERSPVSSVQGAKDALKPPEVWAAIHEHRVSRKSRDHRRTDAFVRQGEWFFIPRPRLVVNELLVLRNEPIRRGAGKPHMCQFVYRVGGEQVYVSSRYPDGLTVKQYGNLSESDRKRSGRWNVMVRDARVYAKGAIRHPDHRTVWLSGWHQVVMNTETESQAMRHVAFLD